MGTKKSGIWGHIRGWNVGARVEIYFDEATKKDLIRVYKTSGSSGGESDKLIKEFKG